MEGAVFAPEGVFEVQRAGGWFGPGVDDGAAGGCADGAILFPVEVDVVGGGVVERPHFQDGAIISEMEPRGAIPAKAGAIGADAEVRSGHIGPRRRRRRALGGL